MGSKLNHPYHNLTTRSVSAKEASLIHSASPKDPFIMPQCTEKKKNMVDNTKCFRCYSNSCQSFL